MADLDLLGDAVTPVRAKPTLAEAAALVEVMRALRAHPAVAWVERANSGAARMGKRYVRFGWPGCPDVLGQLKDGRLLGVEVKAPKGRLRLEQAVFLERIVRSGGVAFVARSLRDVAAVLGPMDGSEPPPGAVRISTAEELPRTGVFEQAGRRLT
jgi:hypothetical protein